MKMLWVLQLIRSPSRTHVFSVCVCVHKELSLTSRSRSQLNRCFKNACTHVENRFVRPCVCVPLVHLQRRTRRNENATTKKTKNVSKHKPYREDARATAHPRRRARAHTHLYDPVMCQNINEAFKLSDMRAHIHTSTPTCTTCCRPARDDLGAYVIEVCH